MNQVPALLIEERAQAEALLEVLREEERALIGVDGERVIELAERKTELVAQLNELARKRQAELQLAGHSGSLSDWLETTAPDSLPQWNGLREVMELAKQQNEVNGRLIQIRQRHNQQQLTALYNAAQHTTAGLYGRDGQQSVSSSGRTLGTG